MKDCTGNGADSFDYFLKMGVSRTNHEIVIQLKAGTLPSCVVRSRRDHSSSFLVGGLATEDRTRDAFNPSARSPLAYIKCVVTIRDASHVFFS